MSSYFRSASLRGFRSVVAELGGRADDLALEVGIDPRAFDHDDLLVEGHRSAALLELAAERLDCHDLGLQMAGRQSLSVLGALAIALMNCPTLGSTLAVVNGYMSVHSQFVSFGMGADPRGEAGTAALFYRPARRTGPVQAVDLGTAFIHRGIEHLNGGAYGLREVMLPYPQPDEESSHQAFFDAPITFDSPVSTAAVLRIPADLPDKALAGGDEAMRQLAIAYLDRTTSRSPDDLIERTRQAVRGLLSAGRVDQRSVARVLAVHPRTLHRRLAVRGTTYSDLVDQVRRDTALQLLVGTDVPLGRVAQMCGFDEQSSFTRAARRWWDCPPRTLRRRARAEQDPGVRGSPG